MSRLKVIYPKYLILLTLVSSLFLLSAFYSDFSEISGTVKTSSSINSKGEYPSFTPKGDIRRFAGETLTYDIDFLFFEKAATAKVRFYEHQGKFFATLSAETKGVVGFFTNYRKHYYKSSFDIVDEGRRVQTSKFERDV